MDKNWNVLFCDVDDVTANFFSKTTLPSIAKCKFLKKSLNDIPTEEIKDLANSNVISTFVYSRLSANLLKNFKNLKLVCTRSTGYNNVDLEYCKANGIKVANVIGYGAITVAEYAMGLLLNLTKNVNFSNEKLKRGIVNINEDMGIDLHGKTIGVIGTGAIGKHFVELSHAFGCNVLTYDPYPNHDLIASKICEYVDLKDLLSNSDAISLHCPATPENHHLINYDTIKQMKDGVYIINTARGELIDTMALYEGLLSQKVRGAALDVLDYEDVLIKGDLESLKSGTKEFAVYSTINTKLLHMPNVIITPHIAFNSYDAVLKILNSNLTTISDFISGKEIKTVA